MPLGPRDGQWRAQRISEHNRHNRTESNQGRNCRFPLLGLLLRLRGWPWVWDAKVSIFAPLHHMLAGRADRFRLNQLRQASNDGEGQQREKHHFYVSVLLSSWVAASSIWFNL
jgi:hypothetical protein